MRVLTYDGHAIRVRIPSGEEIPAGSENVADINYSIKPESIGDKESFQIYRSGETVASGSTFGDARKEAHKLALEFAKAWSSQVIDNTGLAKVA